MLHTHVNVALINNNSVHKLMSMYMHLFAYQVQCILVETFEYSCFLQSLIIRLLFSGYPECTPDFCKNHRNTFARCSAYVNTIISYSVVIFVPGMAEHIKVVWV